MSLFLLIFGLILFVGLVIIHEFGHFIMARRNGVEVEEFGIGFPPRAKILARKNGTTYSLNWLPLGGFVKLKGEHDADNGKGTFGAASLGAKTKIMLAGVVMNLIAAFVLLTLLALVGMPKLLTADNIGVEQFTVASDTKILRQAMIIPQVEPNSPAAKAGIQAYDELVSIDPVNGPKRDINSETKIPELTKSLASQQAVVEYRRDGKLFSATVTLRSDAEVSASQNSDNPKGYLGIYQPSEYQLRRSTWSAPIVAAGVIKQFTELTFKGIGSALKGLGSIIVGALTGNNQARQNGQTKATEQVAGPLGIFVILRSGSNLGVYYILMIIAVISLTLAIMNVLPIPALDGGRLFLTLLFRGLRKPLTHRIEEIVVGSSFALLMLLFVLITIVDAKRFF